MELLSVVLKSDLSEVMEIIKIFSVFLIFIVVYIIRSNIYNYDRSDFNALKYRFANLGSDKQIILERYFRFYNELPDEKLKSLFRKRVAFFMKIKKFIPRGGLESVSDEMKVLISASAVQLLFGYPGIYLIHFKHFFVYPQEFTLPESIDLYDGKVNLKGAILLSWKSFVNGYKYPEDGRNLGLHEMAHAMYFENAYKNIEYNFIDRRALLKLAVIIKNELARIESGDGNFFREYATRDRHEFFAVAVESFFERPSELYDYNQDLYNVLVVILNQNPVEKKYFIRKRY